VPPFRQGHIPISHNAGPDCGITLGSPQCTTSPTRCPGQRPPASRSEASRMANTGKRRSHHSSVLLASPARRGHAVSMSQIFHIENEDRDSTEKHSGVSYPQLPNISRVCSPKSTRVGLCDTTGTAPRFSLQETGIHPVSPARETARDETSSSISSSTDIGLGDVDCLVPGILPHGQGMMVMPRSHANRWPSSNAAGKVDTLQSSPGSDRFWPTSTHLEFRKRCSVSASPNPDPPQNADQAAIDTHLRDSSAALPPIAFPEEKQQEDSTVHTPDRDRASCDESLGPLSPNVCIERGPSRYHASQKHLHADHTSATPKLDDVSSRLPSDEMFISPSVHGTLRSRTRCRQHPGEA
jgi:hypothetical protein